MEFASVLAGEQFGDDPRCIHPALAAVARAVNDDIQDDGYRGLLSLLVPDMIAIDEWDPRVGAQVVTTCLLAAAAIRPLPRSAARRLIRVSRRTRRPGAARGRGGTAWMRCRSAFAPHAPAARRARRFFQDHAGAQVGTVQDRRLHELRDAVVADCGVLDAPVAHRGTAARSYAD